MGLAPLAGQQRLDFHYHYSIWQLEYSRNYLFKEAQVLEEVFQKLRQKYLLPFVKKECGMPPISDRCLYNYFNKCT